MTDVITNFGQPLAPPATPDVPATTSRSRGAHDRGRLRRRPGGQHLRAQRPHGRLAFYKAKLAWFRRLQHWLVETRQPGEPLVVGGDFNVAPDDADVWDPARCHGGTHVSPPEREAFADLGRWGLVDAYRRLHPEPERYSWWDYRAGNFHKNFGMRIDHLLVTRAVAERVVWAEIDREARKGKPIPSDHAPVIIDLDEPGRPIRRGLGRRQRAHRRAPHPQRVELRASCAPEDEVIECQP